MPTNYVGMIDCDDGFRGGKEFSEFREYSELGWIIMDFDNEELDLSKRKYITSSIPQSTPGNETAKAFSQKIYLAARGL